jgi:hypothetical protein
MTDPKLTPPPELVEQWMDAPHGLGLGCHRARSVADETYAKRLTEAAQWGADQELEACCEYVYERLKLTTAAHIAQDLRAARRPKPPSLKEQALQALSEAVKMADDFPPEGICSDQADIIRRALEQLPDHE